MIKRAVVVFCSLVAVFAGLLSHQLGHFRAATDTATDIEDSGYEYYYSEDEDQGEEIVLSPEPKSTPKKMIDVDTQPDSITVLVNREYRLSEDYVPKDLVIPEIRFSFYGTYEKSYVRQVMAGPLEDLFAQAELEGIILKGVSGYRSYARQEQIYNNNVITRGKDTTDLVSANPGSSEHQTGLAIDVSSSSVGCALEASFGDTPEGEWLAKNCHKFGFIIRYPEDKTEITGYTYEPWHIRYVGKRLAKHLHKKKLTLEEYYQITAAEDKITEPLPEIQDIEDESLAQEQITTAPTPAPTKEPTVTATPTKKPKATPKVTKKPKKTKEPVVSTEPVATEVPAPEPVVTEAPVTPELEETLPPATQPPEQETPVADTSGKEMSETVSTEETVQ